MTTGHALEGVLSDADIALAAALSVAVPTITAAEAMELAPGMIDHLRAQDFDVLRLTSSPRTADRDLLMPHGEGCRCWPHVGQRDAHEATVEAARLEYLSCRKAAAEPTALLRELVEVIAFRDYPRWKDNVIYAAARAYLEEK